MNARADTFNFVEPLYLWLLVVPAALLLGWTWMLLTRRADARRAARAQVLPRDDETSARGGYAAIGDLPFWLAVLIASSLCVVAVARPYIVVWESTTGGADFVILQDGSSSMYVRDVAPDRWQRSMRFLRTFAETLSWKDDRVGLALFAYFAAPQLRLTKDPEALFFFLDHLAEQSPFRLEDDPTWNTNIEEGITWGLRLIQTNEELFGRTNHPKAFVVISDGQAWSGKVESALAAARAADVAVYVVGVGTTAGGYIPATSGRTARASGIYSVLDRESLRDIARAAGGDYFEVGRQPDRDVASRIISAVRRRAPVAPREETRQELYWPLLMAAAVVLCAGTLVIRNRTEVVWYVAAAMAGAILLSQK